MCSAAQCNAMYWHSGCSRGWGTWVNESMIERQGKGTDAKAFCRRIKLPKGSVCDNNDIKTVFKIHARNIQCIAWNIDVCTLHKYVRISLDSQQVCTFTMYAIPFSASKIMNIKSIE